MTSEDISSVFRVWPENVTRLWPQLKPLFADALSMCSTHDDDDIKREIMGMKCQLWVQMHKDVVLSAIVSEFVPYPSGTFVRIRMAGALPNTKANKEEFAKTLNKWRIEHGCVGFEAMGRHGWLGVFPWLKVEGLIMRGVPPWEK